MPIIAISPGTEFSGVTRYITQESIDRYAEASGDFNPIHIDEEFARSTSMGGTIAHGMMPASLLSEIMLNVAASSWMHTGELNVKFVRPVRPGDTIRAHGQITTVEPIGDGRRRVNCSVGCTNQHGEDVIVGTASYEELVGRTLPSGMGSTEPYWSAAAEGRVVYQWCPTCEQAVFPPRVLCTQCGNSDQVWRESDGKGTIYSYTIVHRPRHAYFQGKEPYAVALVDVEPGVRLMSNIINVDMSSIRVGMKVRVAFEQATRDIGVLLFQPEGDS